MNIDCIATPSPPAAPGTPVGPSEIPREILASRYFDEFSVLHDSDTEVIVMGRSGKYEERMCLFRASRQQPWMVIRHDFVCRDCPLTQTPGQSVDAPTIDAPVNRGNVDYPAVSLEQAADVIVVLVPDEDFGLAPHERVVNGFVIRLDKGPMPHRIVFTAYSMLTPLEKGVPAKLFLKTFTDRDACYIIGNFAAPSGE
jgi:hypothetical protein